MRQYVKFFYGLLSIIEGIQKVTSFEDWIEVESDSDPYDSTWKVNRRKTFDKLIANAESFDFTEEQISVVLDNAKEYKQRWNISESVNVTLKRKLNESVLDDIEKNDIKVSNVISSINDDQFYEHQLKLIIGSANQFRGKSFNLQQRRDMLADVLDYWEPQIHGHGEIHFEDTLRNENFWFYMSDKASFKTPQQMERFLKSMLLICGEHGYQKDRRLYILQWNEDMNDYRFLKEYTDYEYIYDFNSHYPYKSFQDLYTIFVPIGKVFGLPEERVKKYVRDKFEFDEFGHSNLDYKGVRYGNILDREE